MKDVLKDKYGKVRNCYYCSSCFFFQKVPQLHLDLNTKNNKIKELTICPFPYKQKKEKEKKKRKDEEQIVVM
jgi:hypothetical protein